MPEISKIERKGITYDIKDRIARQLVGQKYNKPSDGIPIDDLSDDIKTLLRKVENATEFTETDPTVPSWAKQQTKPTYTAQEVGALPASTTIPTKVSDLTNDAGYTTNTGTVTGISVNGGTAQQPTNGVVNLTVATGGDNDIVGISDGTAGDGAVIFTKRNGDTITLNLNHVHSQYLKYELLADEAAYTALATKDSSTLYLIPES